MWTNGEPTLKFAKLICCFLQSSTKKIKNQGQVLKRVKVSKEIIFFRANTLEGLRIHWEKGSMGKKGKWVKIGQLLHSTFNENLTQSISG